MKILRAILTDLERLGQLQVAIRVSPQADNDVHTTLAAIPGVEILNTSSSGLLVVANITSASVEALENLSGVVVTRHYSF